MRRWPRVLTMSIVVVVCGVATIVWALLPGLTLLPPHPPARSRAILEAPLQQHLRAALARARLTNVDEVLRFALSETGARLHFGLTHKTHMAFRMPEREGNCIEYAHLFAAIFELAAASSKFDAHAYAVHSAHARMFDRRLPWRGFGDHDWVLIVDRTAHQRLYVDPTLHDFGLGWSIESSVKGRDRILVK
jgi:hypothetical protein